MSKIHRRAHAESDERGSCGCTEHKGKLGSCGCAEHSEERGRCDVHKHSVCGCHSNEHCACDTHESNSHDGCGCHSHGETNHKGSLIRIILSAVLLIAVSLTHTDGALRLALFMVPYLVIGYDILSEAFKSIIRREPFDENFLMAIATVGAIALGEYAEGVFVMLFYQVGVLFEGYAVGRSRKNIAKLMDIKPEYANIEDENGSVTKVSPESVGEGSIIVVKPGEKVPIDGTVIDGASSVNVSALTGESMPYDVSAGDEVISGSVNLTGVIRIKTTKAFGESAVSKILELVENASSKKSKSEQFIKKFAYVYTPVVCYLALALGILPPAILMIMGKSAAWGEWIYRALTFLVISCPCALVISIPLSLFAGIGGASRSGILIKGSNFIETLSKVKCVMFDKTGTLTKGEFEVVYVYKRNMSADKVLYMAALAESYSDHPVSRSLRNVFTGELDKSKVSGTKEISGHGVTCEIGGRSVAVGNERLMDMLCIAYKKPSRTGTAIHLAVDGAYEGYILIRDSVKDDSKKAVSLLGKMGIKDTVMLTGDTEATAKAVAGEIGIGKVYSKLLPSGKVDVLEDYLSKMSDGKKLAFVGDGINDAPVLSRADVGIAMGANGLDAAIEAADVVLMDDSPSKVADAIGISKKCMRIVYENIYFSIGVKVLFLLLGALGVANMWLAVFADVGVMVIAVINAVRCLKYRRG